MPWEAKGTMRDKQDEKDDPCMRFAKWSNAYGVKAQPEWVHLFCHTLDVIPMNSYMEREPCHGTCEWDILREGFIMTFSVEDGFDCINEVLQEVKSNNIQDTTGSSGSNSTRLDYSVELGDGILKCDC